MEEAQKLIIMRILIIIGVIVLILNFIMEIAALNIRISGILYLIIAIVLIIICIKPNEIPQRGYLLLILGIVILIIGIFYNTGIGLVGIIIAGILVALAGILDLFIK